MGFLSYVGHRSLGVILYCLSALSFFMIFPAIISGSVVLYILAPVFGILLSIAGTYFFRTKH